MESQSTEAAAGKLLEALTPQAESGSLARALQATLLLELAILGIGLGALWKDGYIAGWQWLALAAGWYLGFRAVAVGWNFLNTWLARSERAPEHQLGPLQTLRLLWGEYYATLIVYSFLFPFERRLVPLAPKPVFEGRGTPLILVHGFACNRGYWWWFARWLHQAGYASIYAVSLEPLLGSIDENARRLGERIEAVCKAAGAQKVILVGHSMGGIVARAYLHKYGGARIEQIVAIGSPHYGTVLTRGIGFVGENVRQMSRNSSWSKALNEHKQRDCPVPISAVVTPHDNIVSPQDSCVLRYPNARNYYTPGVGHLEMVISKPVFEATLKALRSA